MVRRSETITYEVKIYQTIAGFVLTQLRAPPAVGESFEFAEYRFEILDFDYEGVVLIATAL